MTQSRSFKVHPALIFDVICKQAGSISKAILESVMNSVDAGATECIIEVGSGRYSVKDDGRGFKDRAEIESFFETFGTPHEAGDAVFGRFRMGRGQGFSFGVNEWRTGAFAMSVDIKRKGLDYVLNEGLPNHSGCHIVVDLYKAISPMEILSLVREIKRQVEWIDLPIYLNGELISQSPKGHDWTVEADDFYIKKTSSGGVRIFNQGAYVCVMAAHQMFGFNGIVVSKVPLQVNFARNDILTHECSVFAEIRKTARKIADKDSSGAKEKLSDDRRRAVLEAALAGEVSSESALHDKLVPLAGGRYTSMVKIGCNLTIERGLSICPATKDKRIIDAVRTNNSNVIIVSDALLEWLGISSACPATQSRELMTAFSKICQTEMGRTLIPANALREKSVIDFEELAKGISLTNVIVKKKDYTKKEMILMRALSRHIQHRRLVIGESEVALAWTDGSKTIALNRTLLKDNCGSFSGISRIVNIIAHELTHDTNNVHSDVHDVEFYEAFHNKMVGGEFGDRALVIAITYMNMLIAEKISPPASLRKSFAAVMEVINMDEGVEDTLSGFDTDMGLEDLSTEAA